MKKLRDLRKLDSRGSFTVSGGTYTAWRSFGLPSKSLWLMHQSRAEAHGVRGFPFLSVHAKHMVLHLGKSVLGWVIQPIFLAV